MATVTTLNGEFDLRQDLDYFRVTLEAGQRVLFKMNGSGTTPLSENALAIFVPRSTPGWQDWSVYDSAPTASGGAVFAFVAQESGTHWVLANSGMFGYGGGLGDYTVSAQVVAADDHDDRPSRGTALAVGSSVNGAFDLRHDLDYFKVELVGGTRYQFTMTGSGAAPVSASQLALFDAGSGQLGGDMAITSAGGATFVVTAPSSGTFYLRSTLLSGYGSQADTGTYLTSLKTVALDDHSDLPSLGTPLAPGQTLQGAFDLRHDLDHFNVELVQGQRYFFTMNGAGASPVQGSDLALYSGTSGVTPLVGTFVDDSADTALGGAKFSFVAPATGTYTLLATLGQGAAGGNGDTGTYAVSLQSIALDDHADLPANGTALTVGQTLAGEIDRRMDLDYFLVDLSAGQRVVVKMTGTGATPVNAAMLTLESPLGAMLGFDYATGMDFGDFGDLGDLGDFEFPGFGAAEAVFVATAPTAGTYRVLAEQGRGYLVYGETTTVRDEGDYSVNIETVDLDDHWDLPDAAKATPLAAGNTKTGEFDLRHDADYFAASLVGGQRYLFTLTPVGATEYDIASYYLTLTAADGSSYAFAVADPTLGDAAIAFQAPSSGVYFLLAQKQSYGGLPGGVETGNYTLAMASVALDDHSDLRNLGTVLTLESATPVNQPPTSADGSSSTAEDTALTGTLPAASDPDLDAVGYAKASNPSHGSVTVAADGGFTYTPAADYAGSDSFGFTVSDGKGGSNSYTFSVSVTAVNDPPVLQTPAPLSYVDTEERDVYVLEAQVPLSASDPDPGTTLTWGLVGGQASQGFVSRAGSYGSLMVDPATGAATFFPNDTAIQRLKAPASETFTVTVSDGQATAQAELRIDVTGANDRPVVAQELADRQATAGQTTMFTVPAGTFTDADADTLTHAASLEDGSPLPAWLAFDAAARSFTATPDAAQEGTWQVTVTASDGALDASDTFELTVQATAPVNATTLAIARMANAWFNGTFGNGTMTVLESLVQSTFLGNPVLFAAEVYYQYGSIYPTSTLAQSVANNLGLQGDANLELTVRIRDALDAISDPNPTRVLYLRGEKLLEETERFAALVDDPVYGEAAQRFNAEIDAALRYAKVPGTLNELTNPDGSPIVVPGEASGAGRVGGLALGLGALGADPEGPTLPGPGALDADLGLQASADPAHWEYGFGAQDGLQPGVGALPAPHADAGATLVGIVTLPWTGGVDLLA